MKPPLVLALLLVASGCGSVGGARSARAEPAPGTVTRIAPGVVDGAAAHELRAAGVRAVDVRTPEEFQAGHIPGAVNIPYDQMGWRHPELGPPSTPVLVYCKSGARSGLAARTLREHGFAEVYDLQSYDRWVAAERAEGAR